MAEDRARPAKGHPTERPRSRRPEDPPVAEAGGALERLPIPGHPGGEASPRWASSLLLRSDAAARARLLAGLQRSSGNASVQSLVAGLYGPAAEPDGASSGAERGTEAGQERDPVALGPAHERDSAGPEQSSMQAAVQRTPQRRLSLDTAWYVEMDPASSIVPVGTQVTFRLRNEDDAPWAAWQREQGEAEARPVFGVRERGGRERSWYASPNYPVTVRRRFDRAGNVEVFFQGRPGRPAGPGMVIPGSPIYVSVEMDVVQQLTRETVEAEPRRATYREDINRLEDPRASDQEIAQAFLRVAVRRGIDIVNRNKQEAWDLLQMYTRGGRGRSAAEATEDLQRVLRFDAELAHQAQRLRSASGISAAGVRSLAELQARLQSINLVRASLVDAFPAMGVAMGGGPLATMVRRGESGRAQQSLRILLGRVLRDCDTTRQGLATGDLHIFDVERVVREVRQATGIDSDPRRRRAVDSAIRQHRRSSLAASLGLAGAALVLLLVPGLGPYMSAAVGLAAAGVSWERAGDLLAASGAGVRGGIVGRGEAAAAVFWATIETLLAGLDVAAAVRPLARIAPHVPAAADRLVPRASGVAARTAAGRVAPRAAAASLEEGHPLAMSAEELTEFCARLFRRPVRPMTGRAHLYGSWADYASEFRRYWPAPQPIPTGGYLNPATGHLHVAPRGNLLTAIHEAIHQVANDTFPMGRQLLGDFLDEGITEAITRARLGPQGGRHGYDAHVAFVTLLQGRVGRSTVENALLHGAYRQLRDAVRTALGGSEARTMEFFTLLRRIGSDASGSVADPGALSRAIDMLGGMAPRRR